MSPKIRLVLVGAMITLGLLLLVWWLLPRGLDLLPGSIRARIPEEVLALITTPLPTALPTSEYVGSVSPPSDIITSLIIATDQAPSTLTPLPTFTATLVETGPRFSETIVVEPTVTPTFAPTQTPLPTSTSVPNRVVVDGLEVIPQKFNNCGPANLTIALRYYGVEADQLVVAERLRPHYDDRNVSPDELVYYVNSKTTLRAATYAGGDSNLLKQLLAAGFPVIVEKGLHLSKIQGWMGHYLTLYGYDENEAVFHTLDTYLGPWDGGGRPVDFQSFTEQWVHFNNTFIVVYKETQEESLAELLGPEMLVPESMWRNAAQQAQRLIEQDPENSFAWFNLGTSLTQLGKLNGEDEFYTNAAVAFDKARELGLPWRMVWYQFEIYVGYLAAGRFDEVLTLTSAALSDGGGRDVEETYVYRGHALVATGDMDGAMRAYRQALVLNPNSPLVLEAASAAGLVPEVDANSGRY